jgi:hypothetical protein
MDLRGATCRVKRVGLSLAGLAVGIPGVVLASASQHWSRSSGRVPSVRDDGTERGLLWTVTRRVKFSRLASASGFEDSCFFLSGSH